jgi:hypothetical protein
MEYEIIREEHLPNGMCIQIIKTNECGGRYYMVTDGEIGFHSVDRERVEEYVNSIMRSIGRSR